MLDNSLSFEPKSQINLTTVTLQVGKCLVENEYMESWLIHSLVNVL